MLDKFSIGNEMRRQCNEALWGWLQEQKYPLTLSERIVITLNKWRNLCLNLMFRDRQNATQEFYEKPPYEWWLPTEGGLVPNDQGDNHEN